MLLHVVLHIGMELELISLESNRKVALGDPVPAGLEGHLIASKPALVAHHRRTVDGCAIDVIVNIAAKVDVLTLVACLELAAFLAGQIFKREKKKKLAMSWHIYKHHTSVALN